LLLDATKSTVWTAKVEKYYILCGNMRGIGIGSASSGQPALTATSQRLDKLPARTSSIAA
jgi:hypothetical protein